MANTVVFLWISVGSSLVPPPQASAAMTPQQAEALKDFGAAHGMTLVAPAGSRPVGLADGYDSALVLSLESELEQARTALSALEEARATERLARVEADLLAHPYLPQATFLMGECLALQAQAARENSPEAARLLEARREALEGPRAQAFGESALPSAGASVTPKPRLVQGLAPIDELELDGNWVGHARQVELAAGRHHVRVHRHGRLVHAAFAELVAEQGALELDAPPLVPCSSEDLESVNANQPAHGVRCERWAMVRADVGGGIGVALCRQDECSPFTHWQRRAPAPFRPIADEHSQLPAWTGFAVAGASLLVASGLVLWQAGAFERGHPTATSWQFGGLNPQGGVRF